MNSNFVRVQSEKGSVIMEGNKILRCATADAICWNNDFLGISIDNYQRDEVNVFFLLHFILLTR